MGNGYTITVLGGSAAINGGAASDTLVATGTTSHDWQITAQNTGSLDGQVFFSNVEQLIGGSGVDLFHFANGVGVNGLVDGGGGSDTLDYAAFTTSVSMNLQSGNATKTGGTSNIEQVIGGTGSDSLTGSNTVNLWASSSANAGSVNGAFAYSSFENITGGNQPDTFVISAGTQISGNLAGGGGSDILEYADSANNVVNLGTQSATAIGGTFSSISQILFGSGNDTLVGPFANATWTLSGTQAGMVSGVSFQNADNLVGGAIIDTVRGPDQANLWQLTGPNAGTLLGVAWTGMERLTGGSQVDDFQVLASGGLSGILSGGGGSDVLNYANHGSGVTVNLAASASTDIASFASIASFIGSASADVFIAADSANTWTIHSADSGTVLSKTFSGMETLRGGSGADTFRVNPGVAFAGTLDGSGGADKLDYAAHTAAVEVNLILGTATGAGGVTGMENITGGGGNDFLVGSAAVNVIHGGDGSDVIFGGSGGDTLNGNGGRDLIVGGSGIDTIHGNSMEDIIVGGALTYASESSTTIDRTALDAIMAEWRRTDLVFADRVGHISGSTSGGLNGAYVLNSTTVLDDNVTDQLFGDGGTDWFVAGDKDSVHQN
ncbi:MAG: calcium-binding protein [Pirellulaceae bacterium]|nr:calcium-binding protein [Pirellulaceae bacterium]